jgi:hypothetical protein
MNPQPSPTAILQLGGLRKLPIDLGTVANIMYSTTIRFELNHVRYLR